MIRPLNTLPCEICQQLKLGIHLRVPPDEIRGIRAKNE